MNTVYSLGLLIQHLKCKQFFNNRELFKTDQAFMKDTLLV